MLPNGGAAAAIINSSGGCSNSRIFFFRRTCYLNTDSVYTKYAKLTSKYYIGAMFVIAQL
jgi:hypothetical protein